MAFTSAPMIVTDSSTAELAKYGSNAFLAMRVSFANEIARLAEREGADALMALEGDRTGSPDRIALPVARRRVWRQLPAQGRRGARQHGRCRG